MRKLLTRTESFQENMSRIILTKHSSSFLMNVRDLCRLEIVPTAETDQCRVWGSAAAVQTASSLESGISVDKITGSLIPSHTTWPCSPHYPEAWSICVCCAAGQKRWRSTQLHSWASDSGTLYESVVLMAPPSRGQSSAFCVQSADTEADEPDDIWLFISDSPLFPQFGPTWSLGQCQCSLGTRSSLSWSPANQERPPSLLMANSSSIRAKVAP